MHTGSQLKPRRRGNKKTHTRRAGECVRKETIGQKKKSTSQKRLRQLRHLRDWAHDVYSKAGCRTPKAKRSPNGVFFGWGLRGNWR